ncbi:MAG: PQQ-binding-like beta-propeller repeat protein [Mariniblastus sp.]
MSRKRILTSVVATLLCTAAATLNAQQTDWPTFRGANRTAVAPDTNLLEAWPKGGPDLLWTAKGAGRGYASVVISGDKMFTLGDALSTATDKDEYLTCYSVADGSQIWKSKTGSPWKAGKESWQSSRSTPTVDGDHVYVISPQGKLVCVSTDGDEKWRVDLKDKFGGKKAEMWGYSESVLIDGDNLICTPGGPANTMVALNKKTGEKVWSTPRDGDRGAGHASIVISEIGGTKVYVQTTGSGAMGVRASDGKLLWTYDIDRTTAVIPTPIIRDDLVFFAAGYNRGGALLRQKKDGDGVSVEEIYPLNPKLSNKHGGIVLIGDYLYGDSDDKGVPYCAELMTGEIKWKSRGSGRQSASIVAADGHLYILYSNGMMTLVKANPESMEEVGSFKVPGSGQRPSWAHPVILAGKLYLREGDTILCYDLTGMGNKTGANAADDKRMKVDAAGELLANGDFSDGMTGWFVDKGANESGKTEVTKDGPEGAASAKITVVSAPDEPWQLQMFHKVKIEKGTSYLLSYWAKAKDGTSIKTNCMQNHEPWEHSTEEEIYVGSKWKKYEFSFEGPWDDDNGRITFTNLGQDTGQVFWFSNVSLIQK